MPSPSSGAAILCLCTPLISGVHFVASSKNEQPVNELPESVSCGFWRTGVSSRYFASVIGDASFSAEYYIRSQCNHCLISLASLAVTCTSRSWFSLFTCRSECCLRWSVLPPLCRHNSTSKISVEYIHCNTDLGPKTRKLLHALSSRVWFFLGYKVRLRLNFRECPHSPLTD